MSNNCFAPETNIIFYINCNLNVKNYFKNNIISDFAEMKARKKFYEIQNQL